MQCNVQSTFIHQASIVFLPHVQCIICTGGSSNCITEADGSSFQCNSRAKSPAFTLRMRGNTATFMPLPLPENTAPPTCAAIGFTIDIGFLIQPSCERCYDTAQGFTVSLLSAPAMGTGGDQLGIGGVPGLAVAFDATNQQLNIDIGGSLEAVTSLSVTFDMVAATYVKHARIQYDPVSEMLSVLLFNDFDSASDMVLTGYVDICSILSLGTTPVAPTLYVGFTAGRAETYDTRYFIFDWQVTTGAHWTSMQVNISSIFVHKIICSTCAVPLMCCFHNRSLLSVFLKPLHLSGAHLCPISILDCPIFFHAITHVSFVPPPLPPLIQSYNKPFLRHPKVSLFCGKHKSIEP